ncbi:MAG TPA: hypothetical protein VJU78_01190, partial [Chitinophagaceae bacterium]|nr:hypothetical protein [Chitinophagaceae bacterium]
MKKVKEIEIEKVRGRFTLKAAIIPSVILAVASIITLFFTNKKDSPENNSIDIKENKNSPVANKIETQNNFYLDTTKKVDPPPPLQSNPLQKEKAKEAAKPISNETTINADNALIVTNNQSGGSNTVVQQIPEPVLKEVNHEKKNEKVTEIKHFYGGGTKINLPTTEYDYPFLYQSLFTLNYFCQASVKSVKFTFNDNNVVLGDLTKMGYLNWQFVKGTDKNKPHFIVYYPENGDYEFMIYTKEKINNPLTGISFTK